MESLKARVLEMPAATRKRLVLRHTDLEVYQRSFELARRVFKCSKKFPSDERYSLIDQIRRSSRSVCANLAEAWRKRRYEAAFVAKLSDSEAEAAETQTWIEFAVDCEYLTKEDGRKLWKEYDAVIAMLVDMITHSARWTLK